LPESERVVTLRAPRFSKLVPGEIAKIVPHKQWSYAGHSYLSGQILSTQLDVATLGLVPLRLERRGTWDPKEEYWGEEGEVLDDRAKAIIAWGPRQSFEMEQLLPMDDPDDPDGDSIIRSNDLERGGDYEAACQILMEQSMFLPTNLGSSLRPWAPRTAGRSRDYVHREARGFLFTPYSRQRKQCASRANALETQAKPEFSSDSESVDHPK
jgi:hypothetical protein